MLAGRSLISGIWENRGLDRCRQALSTDSLLVTVSAFDLSHHCSELMESSRFVLAYTISCSPFSQNYMKRSLSITPTVTSLIKGADLARSIIDASPVVFHLPAIFLWTFQL